MLDFRQLVKALIEQRCHKEGIETEADKAVIEAVNRRDEDLNARRKSIVDWLNHYKVLMGISNDDGYFQ